MGDLPQFSQLHERNKQHWQKWEATVHPTYSYEEQLKLWIDDCRINKSARFLIFEKESKQLIGFCNFTQIFHGAFHACYLGYKIDWEFEGKGLMTEALQRSIQFVFENFKLHRIMANYMPSNERSARLLQRLGFKKEGYAPHYLLINNRWEDHILTALTNEKWILS